MTEERGPEAVIQIRRTTSGYRLLHIHGGEGEEVVVDGTLGDVHRAIDRLHEAGARQGRGPRGSGWERGGPRARARTGEGLEGTLHIWRPTGGYRVVHARPDLEHSVDEEVVVDGTLEEVHRAIDRLHEVGAAQRAELRERIRRELGPPHSH
ncbi:hypothetical protein HRbin12_00360 [bacterium HR12]|nr:hypothetical protein HRbin12_00360 [bacterium HR12]